MRRTATGGNPDLNVAAFLNELLNRDIRVSADGERLRCSAPPGGLTPELRAELARRKDEILEFLRKAEQIARQPDGIVPLQPRGTRIPVYAVGGHNGDIFAFSDLVRHLGDDQPFFGLQPPGLSRIEDIAGTLAAQIRAFQPRGRFIIAGYCAGGAVAFELARQLARAGDEPALVALFGCPHPSVYRFNLRYWVGRMWLHLRNVVRLRSFEYLTARVRERLKWLRVERTEAALTTVRQYTPGPYCRARVPLHSEEGVAARQRRRGTLALGGAAHRRVLRAGQRRRRAHAARPRRRRLRGALQALPRHDRYRRFSFDETAGLRGRRPQHGACARTRRHSGRRATRDPASKVSLSRYCTAEVRTPGWVDGPDAALAALIAWGAGQREAPVVFYQGDHDMLALSRGRGRLAPHLRCVLAPAELVEEVADKLRFAALAERERLPVPFTLTVSRGSAAAAELARWERFPWS